MELLPFPLFNHSTNFYETWYERRVIGYRRNDVLNPYSANVENMVSS